jgi:hypothetical protein
VGSSGPGVAELGGLEPYFQEDLFNGVMRAHFAASLWPFTHWASSTWRRLILLSGIGVGYKMSSQSVRSLLG